MSLAGSGASASGAPPLSFLLVTDMCVDPRLSSSQVHVAQVLEGLLEAGHAVDYAFLHAGRGQASPFLHDMQARYSQFRLLGMAIPAAAEADVLWLTNLWGLPFLQGAWQLLTRLRAAAHKPLRVVFDSLDWLAKGMGATKPGPERTAIAELEAGLRQAADHCVVISEHERAQVLHAFALPEDKVSVLGQAFQIHEPGLRRGHGQREHLCFVGAWSTSNARALDYFLCEILPSLLARAPSIKFHVLGSIGAQAGFRLPPALASAVQVRGFVEDLDVMLSTYRVQVVPLLHGAGIKGKILQSMACGTPVVTTACGAEGLGARPGRELWVAYDPRDFVEATLRLYEDAASWQVLQRAGADFVADQYSLQRFREQLRQLLGRLS